MFSLKFAFAHRYSLIMYTIGIIIVVWCISKVIHRVIHRLGRVIHRKNTNIHGRNVLECSCF